jgi:hypothetical protein
VLYFPLCSFQRTGWSQRKPAQRRFIKSGC